MILLGLTGGIGMGKTTSANILAAMGVAIVDTDEVARRLVQPGEPAVGEIAQALGAEFVDASGQLRRAELARLVFADARARSRLEAILHPRIRQCWQAEVARWRDSDQPIGCVVIPLLFETGAGSAFDAVLCAACTDGTQQARLRARGWSPEEIEQRLAAQWPAAQKAARADGVVWSEGAVGNTVEQLQRILRRLGGIAPR